MHQQTFSRPHSSSQSEKPASVSDTDSDSDGGESISSEEATLESLLVLLDQKQATSIDYLMAKLHAIKIVRDVETGNDSEFVTYRMRYLAINMEMDLATHPASLECLYSKLNYERNPIITGCRVEYHLAARRLSRHTRHIQDLESETVDRDTVMSLMEAASAWRRALAVYKNSFVDYMNALEGGARVEVPSTTTTTGTSSLYDGDEVLF